MSRSKRKTPVIGMTTAPSEKEDKALNHRRHRAKAKVSLQRGDELLPHERETSSPWVMSKDGKVRFNPTVNPELLRK